MRLKFVVALVAGLLSFGAPVAAQNAVPAAPLAVPAITPDNVLHLDLTTGGRVSIQLRPDVAPKHVERIKTLARQGFYNGVLFHRVIEGFMAQTGDPTGTGGGGSPLPDMAAEFNGLPHVRGAVSAARAEEPNSANSQFFIVFFPRLSLDGKYSVFGRVIGGMQFVDAIERGEPPANPSRILKASIGSDNAPPPSPQEVAAAMARQPEPVAQAQAVAPSPAPAPVPAQQPQSPAQQ
jgi:peptidylprolyl isomerase